VEETTKTEIQQQQRRFALENSANDEPLTVQDTQYLEAAEQQQNRIYLVTDGLKSKYTRRDYRLAFNQFLRVGAKTTDLQVLLDYKPKVIEQMVIGYIESLVDKGRARNTIAVHVASILHFFVVMNDIPLNKGKITRFIPPDESTRRDKAYRVEDISAILEQGCDEQRTRVMVLLMASTAMRIGALPGLRYEDLTYVSQYNLYKIEVYATAGKADRYFTYCTPECRAAIDSYLDYRRRLGETITDKSPVIRELFNTKKPYFIEAPRPATPRIIHLALQKALYKAGVNQRPSMGLTNKSNRKEIMPSHGFRKFAITMMNKAGVKDTHRRYLSGHAQVGEDDHYVLPSEEDLLTEYIKAIPLLTIDPKARLQNKVEELESAKDEKIAMLEQEIERNRKRTDHAIAMMEAVKGALDAKSKAASMALKDALGWR
jgi:integrase